MKKRILLLTLIFVSFCFGQAPGNALEFDGVDDYIEIDNVLPIGTISHTVEMIVKIPQVNTKNLLPGERVGILLGNFDAATNANWEIYDEGEMRIYWDGGTIEVLGSTDLRDGKWHHIAFVRDKVADKFLMYIDGNLEADSSGCGADLSFLQKQRIGGDRRATSVPYFHGEIDEMRVWNDVRTPDEIREFMLKEVSTSDASLVAYYKFDVSAGTSLGNAEGTTAYNGTLYNTTNDDWVRSGAFEGSRSCLDFDGIDDYVYLTNSSDLKPTSALTVECWTNPSDWTVSGSIEKIIGNTHSGGYALSLFHDSLRFEAHNNSNYITAMYPASGISSGWHHIAGVFDGTDIILYFDGVELDRTTFGSATIGYHATNYTILGAEADASNGNDGDLFTGKIDEVRVWNDVRTQQEIREWMCRTLRGNEANLAAYYRFDDNYSTRLLEYVADMHGTLQNMDNADWVSSEAFTTWIADYNTDFSDTYNWSGNVPTGGADNVGVITGYSIPSVAGIYTCENLIIPTGRTINIASGNLIINGNYFQHGEITFAGGALSIRGNGFNQTTHRLISTSSADFADKPLFD